MTKTKKRVITCISIPLIIGLLFIGALYLEISPKIFSVEKHIERISKIVDKRYIDSGNYEYTGYSVSPLYNEKDKVEHYLVEFEPTGYVYIETRAYNPILSSFGMAGMYTRSDWILNNGEMHIWQRYRICKDGKEPEPYEGRQWKINEADINWQISYPKRRWEVDENDEFIYYKDSCWRVANTGNDKKYFINTKEGGYIPAVKRGENYLNLISMEEMKYPQENLGEIYPVIDFPSMHKAFGNL